MEIKKCQGCGMTMEEQDDFGLGNIDSIYCRYCVDEEGNFFEHGELLKAMVKRNVFSMGVNLDIAEMVARQTLANNEKMKEMDIVDFNIFDMNV